MDIFIQPTAGKYYNATVYIFKSFISRSVNRLHCSADVKSNSPGLKRRVKTRKNEKVEANGHDHRLIGHRRSWAFPTRLDRRIKFKTTRSDTDVWPHWRRRPTSRLTFAAQWQTAAHICRFGGRLSCAILFCWCGGAGGPSGCTSESFLQFINSRKVQWKTPSDAMAFLVQRLAAHIGSPVATFKCVDFPM